jgi:hypothetical protein
MISIYSIEVLDQHVWTPWVIFLLYSAPFYSVLWLSVPSFMPSKFCYSKLWLVKFISPS